MNRCLRRACSTACLALLFLTGLQPFGAGRCLAESRSADQRLAAARKLVEASDRYLHHSRLKRGMTGYGLTVLAGTEVVRFDVEIVSVMTRMGPHQDVILARLSKRDLAKTGIIQGMSGSPCYVRHEGKDKLIGAVAYGWYNQKEPLCGIQPITQMLAVSASARKPQPQPAASQPATRPEAGPAAAQKTQGKMPAEFLAVVLDPRKRDFSQFAMPSRLRRAVGDAGTMLSPLRIPLMVSGTRGRAVDVLARVLGPAGIMPVQAGGTTAAVAQEAASAKLTPGGAIFVPLVTGDAEFSALGTVTDVADGKVLAFGHSFFADGDVEMPMGPAYIHTVISRLNSSFKLWSGLKVTGTLSRDEMVAVAGHVGPGPRMIPMNIEVRRLDGTDRQGQVENYSFRILPHRWMAPVLASVLTMDVVWQWRNPPQWHTVRHWVTIDFGKLGRYEAHNVSSGRDVFAASSDVSRPIAALLNTPLGRAPEIERIDVKMQIEPGSLDAEIRQLALDGRIYRPGETVTGKLVVRPFRRPRQKIPVSFELPEDLPEGTYKLTACDYVAAVRAMKREKPQQFDPRTVEQLLASIQRTVALPANRLYLRLPLKKGGLALGTKELPDLPGARMAILREAAKLDAVTYTDAVVKELPSRYVLQGSATAKIEIQETPAETLVRQQKE